MADEQAEITLKPIGVIKNAADKPLNQGDWWSELVSEVVVDEEWAEGLDGLEGFSHIIILFYISRLDRPVRMKMHPMGREDIPLTGFFATRTPARPNHIGLTVVRLLERNGNVLKVQGLDALNGSPLLDIKAYIPIADQMLDAETPDWVVTR